MRSCNLCALTLGVRVCGGVLAFLDVQTTSCTDFLRVWWTWFGFDEPPERHPATAGGTYQLLNPQHQVEQLLIHVSVH